MMGHFLRKSSNYLIFLISALLLITTSLPSFADDSSAMGQGSGRMGRLNPKTVTDPGARNLILFEGYFDNFRINASNNANCDPSGTQGIELRHACGPNHDQYCTDPNAGHCPPGYKSVVIGTLGNTDPSADPQGDNPILNTGFLTYIVPSKVYPNDYFVRICAHVYYYKGNSNLIGFRLTVFCYKNE